MEYQHKNGDFSTSQRFYENDKQNRFCSKSVFIQVHNLTKESHERDWLCYSPSKGCLFCFPCKVMNIRHEKFTENGFNEWKNVTARLQQHKKSPDHRSALIAITNWELEKSSINSNLTHAIQKEMDYWQQILTRIVEVIKFLLQRSLAFLWIPHYVTSVSFD